MLSDCTITNKIQSREKPVLKAATVVTVEEKRFPAFCRSELYVSTHEIEQRALTSAIQF